MIISLFIYLNIEKFKIRKKMNFLKVKIFKKSLTRNISSEKFSEKGEDKWKSGDGKKVR
jgi:hypothetical protein